MSLLTVIQNVCDIVGLPQPSLVVGATDITTKQLRACLKDVGRTLATRKDFAELYREHTITLVGDQESYALPVDFNGWLADTTWSIEDAWPSIGPIDQQRLQMRKYGIIPVSPWREWAVRGVTSNRIIITPTPTASEAGQTIKMLYRSNRWFFPQSWTASSSYTAGSFVFSSDTIYETTGGGVSGSTAPTGTGTGINDGGISDWASTTSYATFGADSDQFAYPEHLLEIGVEAYWKERKNFNAQLQLARFENLANEYSRIPQGSKSIDMVDESGASYLIGYSNVPDGNWPSA